VIENGKYKGWENNQIRQDLESQGFEPQLIVEEPNDHLNAHKHPENHILVVVHGEMKLKIDDGDEIMKPGDKITIKSNVSHAAYFGPQGCQYFWIEY